MNYYEERIEPDLAVWEPDGKRPPMRLAGSGSLADWTSVGDGESDAETFWRGEAEKYRVKHAKVKAELERVKARIADLPDMMRKFVRDLSHDVS